MTWGAELNKSYFYDVDKKFGYGNMSYFTYFSEYNRQWKNAGHLEAVIMSTLFVFSILGNVLIVGFLMKYKSSRTITNYFVCNLALSDVLFSLSAPFLAYVRITSDWSLGEVMCQCLNYGMFVCATVMIWTMTVISIDRYMCICKGTTSRTRIRPGHVIVICVSIWVVFLCAFLPIAVFFQVKEVNMGNNTSIKFCTLLWPDSKVRYSFIFTVLVLIIGFIVPLAIIIINYYKIFRKFWMSKRAVGNSINQSSKNHKISTRRSRDLKILKTLVLLVVLFIVMWLPMFIIIGCIQHDVSVSANSISSSALIWTIVVAYVNPCVNPFLYGIMNREVWKCLRAYCKCGAADDDDSTTPTTALHKPTNSREENDCQVTTKM